MDKLRLIRNIFRVVHVNNEDNKQISSSQYDGL